MRATVTASMLNVRPEPSTARPPLGQLPRGTVVEILATHGGWYRVVGGGLEGFVRGDYLALVDPAPAQGFLRHRADLAAIALPAPAPLATAGLSGAALVAARTWNRCGGLLGALAVELAILPSAAVAVLCVESGGTGLGADGRLVIRFENHVFHDQWGSANAAVFALHFRFDPSRRWTGHTFSAAAGGPFSPFHGSQDGEWAAFATAEHLGEPAALRSISMGSPQIMGFNHGLVGYDSAREMLDAFAAGEHAQILGMFDFVKGPGGTSRPLEALQRQQWEQFAAFYNGPGNAAAYGTRIRSYQQACRPLLP